MKVKLSSIVNSRDWLGLWGLTPERANLGGEGKGVKNLLLTPMPAATSIRLMRVVRTCALESEAYEKTRAALLERCGEKGEEDKITKMSQYSFPDADKRVEFAKEYNELMESEVEIPLDAPLPATALQVAVGDILPILAQELEWLFA